MNLTADPDFLIIGAQKSGTTSLYEYLCQHPSILPASKKEIHYFDKNYYKGRLWYRWHFPEKKTGGQLTGEASPSYLFYPGAARRIYKALPRARLLVLLRNPVDRAISAYFHQRQKGVETLSLEEALKREESRLARYRGRLGYGWLSARSNKNLRRFSYRTRGLYAQQLREYLRYFPREQVWIEQGELFFARPKQMVKSSLRFLGLEASYLPSDVYPRNVHHYGQIAASTRQMLEDFYRPHNEELYGLLGRRFDW